MIFDLKGGGFIGRVVENGLYKANCGYYWRFIHDNNHILCIEYNRDADAETGNLVYEMSEVDLTEFVMKHFYKCFDVETEGCPCGEFKKRSEYYEKNN